MFKRDGTENNNAGAKTGSRLQVKFVFDLPLTVLTPR
jgi:hypothetical protein